MWSALVRIAATLGVRRAYWLDGRYHFPMGDGWTISVAAESAGRFRLEACSYSVPRCTLWTSARDRNRLAGLVLELAQDIQGVREGV